MLVIEGRNVNEVYHEAMWKAPIYGIKQQTRNGGVLAFPTPVCSVYTHPWERMLYNVKRDANPFFHIMEGLWMLAEENRHTPLSCYAANIVNYSDDGITLNGAYGHRWRNHFEHDQLEWIINHLTKDPGSRRAVLGMWDPMEDPKSVNEGSLDVPCNTHVYFRVNSSNLEMTVCCRSNDMVWGTYGANVVHMSMLQEFVADALGRPIGKYYQISNNLHVYERHWGLMRPQRDSERLVTYNLQRHQLTTPEGWKQFLVDCSDFFAGKEQMFESPFIQLVAVPMRTIWRLHKMGATEVAARNTNLIHDRDVARACALWLGRRIK